MKQQLLKIWANGWRSWKIQSFGAGIFEWHSIPTLRVFQYGFECEYGETLGVNPRVKFEDIGDLELLDLGTLVKANKTPNQPVEFAMFTHNGRVVLRLPLFVYTTFSGVLNALGSGTPCATE